MVKVFTMVKGEVDIISDWVLYHGHLFGFTNLYIIDNFSRDGTFEELVKLKNKYNINIYRLPDYKKKGMYMSLLIKNFAKNEFVFPIDIDEFIVQYDKKKNIINCDPNIIYNSIQKLPPSNAYKMNYIMSNPINKNGYQRATTESAYGKYVDYGNHAKTFFYSILFKGDLDHGNHYHTQNYYLSDLCLIHYHCRNMEQMKKKIYNNVSGLGHNPFDIRYLKYIVKTNPEGFHHIQHRIQILENTFNLPIDSYDDNDISLFPIINKIQSFDI